MQQAPTQTGSSGRDGGHCGSSSREATVAAEDSRQAGPMPCQEAKLTQPLGAGATASAGGTPHCFLLGGAPSPASSK